MKKLFLGISAMFLFIAGTAPVLGQGQSQWPRFDPNLKKELGTEFTDSLGGRWKFNYEGKRYYLAKVDDGFGGTWNFGYSSHPNSMNISRSFSEEVRYINSIGSPKSDYNGQLKFKKRSLPLDAGLGVAFYGYLTALNRAGANIEALLWVSMKTGEISDVMFRAYLDGNEVLFSVPPRNFALYEDILKKTVKFEVPQGIVHSDSMEEYNVKPESIYYQFDIKFPAPAEGEPDFLAPDSGKD